MRLSIYMYSTCYSEMSSLFSPSVGTTHWERSCVVVKYWYVLLHPGVSHQLMDKKAYHTIEEAQAAVEEYDKKYGVIPYILKGKVVE